MSAEKKGLPCWAGLFFVTLQLMWIVVANP